MNRTSRSSGGSHLAEEGVDGVGEVMAGTSTDPSSFGADVDGATDRCDIAVEAVIATVGVVALRVDKQAAVATIAMPKIHDLRALTTAIEYSIGADMSP
jgi:hypothetical protein